MNQNRLGRFEVSVKSLRHGWRDLLPLFSQVVVVQTTAQFDKGSVEYLGYSDLFDEIEEYVSAPWYTFEFERTLNGVILAKCYRRKEEPL